MTATLVRTVRRLSTRPNPYGIATRRRGYCGGCNLHSFELRLGADGVHRCFACTTFGDPDGADLR